MFGKESLKRNDWLRRLVKKVKIYAEFMHDASDFTKYYMESAEKKGNCNYRIMLLVHNLEKAMCRYGELRPFGYDKAQKLVDVLSCKSNNIGEFEYNLACKTLKAWVEFFKEQNWDAEKAIKIADKFLEVPCEGEAAGYKKIDNINQYIESQNIDDVIFSRYSVRDFQDRELDKADIEYAINAFIKAPTACNRQMCKVYYIKDKSAHELLSNTILGVGGFNKDTVHYFIITYDISAFDFFGERNQGYLNTGLTAMNFANALHARGIGSCFMQWSNRRSEDKNVRKILKLPESERIGVVLGAGYYLETNIVPCSCRKAVSEVYQEI